MLNLLMLNQLIFKFNIFARTLQNLRDMHNSDYLNLYIGLFDYLIDMI